MDRINQHTAPVYEAMLELRKRRMVPFDVPGHKRGRGNPELLDFLGEKCVGVDVNSMKMLDNLSHPISVIREAEELTADAFGAQHAFFMVNGTTSAVQAMVLINQSETKADASADLIIRKPIGQTLAAAVDHLLKR